MNRMMAGGGACVLAVVGSALFAMPSFAGVAQSATGGEFQGEGQLDPSQASPGEQVTASDSSCFEGTTDIWWALSGSGTSEPEAMGEAPLAADGSWELTFAAPDEPGEYVFFGLCLPPGVDRPDASVVDYVPDESVPVELLEAWGVDALLYYAMVLQVTGTAGAPSTSTTAPAMTTVTEPVTEPVHPEALPATAITAAPTFTG